MLRLLLINTALWFWSFVPLNYVLHLARVFYPLFILPALQLKDNFFTSCFHTVPNRYSCEATVIGWKSAWGGGGCTVWKSQLRREGCEELGRTNTGRRGGNFCCCSYCCHPFWLLLERWWLGKRSESHKMDIGFLKPSEPIYSPADFPSCEKRGAPTITLYWSHGSGYTEAVIFSALIWSIQLISILLRTKS